MITASFRFLALPAELRLGIYRALIMTSLKSNLIRDIQGVFLACCQINKEMVDNYISTAWPLLNIMHGRNAMNEETRSFRLHFDDCGNFKEAIQISTIEIPTAILPDQHKTIAMSHGVR